MCVRALRVLPDLRVPQLRKQKRISQNFTPHPPPAPSFLHLTLPAEAVSLGRGLGVEKRGTPKQKYNYRVLG